MLYKKRAIVTMLLLLSVAKQVFAEDFIVRIANESYDDYAKVEIFIYPVNFIVKNYGYIVIKDIKTNELVTTLIKETEVTTPLAEEYFSDSFLENANLNILVSAIPVRTSLGPSHVDEDLVLKKPKVVKFGNSYGLQVPHMEVHIDKRNRARVKCKEKSLDKYYPA